MDVTKQEAQVALDEITRVSEKTKRALSSGAAPEILMLWGVVWGIGYAATHFAPTRIAVIWTIAGGLGALGTFLLEASYAKRVTKADGTKDPNLRKIGWCWLILVGYAILWTCILIPTGGDRDYITVTRQLSAFLTTIPMFAYVIGGLWLGRFYIWLGLIVTAAATIGLYALPELFFIWMAIVGGGALLMSGIYMKRAWGQV